MVSPVPEIAPDFKDSDTVECLVVKTDVFKRLFGSYRAGAAEPTFDGKPDLRAFAYLAHVRGVYSHAMASTSPGDTKLELSLVLGHRIAPFGLQRPIMMMSHVVSLEGVDKLDLSNKNPIYIGLPLRIRDDILASLTQEGQIDGNAEWLRRRFRDGYLLKPYASLAGAPSTVLFLRHLSATLPVRTATSVKPWSKTGVDLEVRDSRTELVDITYRSSWQPGRLLAIGDPSFNISLLRLRGQIHAEARSLVRQHAVANFVKMSEFTSQLPSAVAYVVQASNMDNIRVGKSESRKRWCIPWPIMDQAEAPADMDNVVNNPQYYNKVHDVTRRLTRGKDTTSSYNE
ncbi:hypothetical protein CH63R_14524 [Colletotrichum higginsianum IMI 349063]|uniref:Uncharacterized protein n=1 Tax=Colletotrichum higginsianum (strain IMI 349063) TaxID=759273 RepID=A0A1B7XQA7_COLHI|nr:hypothetical protein CH63R_14524 [Colletotrichum higginsianum IMI 349063]OBR01952.1 hypothetical protein CH63R_14524 [Colletotrichum higginsianum IMI 349063]